MGWWWHGRAGSTARQAFVTLAIWVAPLLAAPPMFSRDVYSYLAQGLMIDAGWDVYRHGPAVLGGLVAEQVPAIWQHTPSPYGPVFLVVAKTVTGVVDTHLIAGVLAMRLVAVAGLALWDTGRVGDLAYVSNQSLRGVVARLGLSPLWWLAAVVVVWVLLVRRADMTVGFALTGVVGCLISPITWVHHLVWLLPALFLLLGDALDRRDPARLTALAAGYVILSSSVVWLWWAGTHGWLAAVGSNTYVWISIGLLAATGRSVATPRTRVLLRLDS